MRTLAFILFLALLPLRVFAQNFTGGFNFFLPPSDTGGSRFIPQFPARPIGDQDFVSIDQEGHFSVRGTPIRFFGSNLVADGAFPTKSKAWFIAGRLRKLGFNLIRFHHMDNPWSQASLFLQGGTTRQLNDATLDRLENVLAELKKNGIYADINLHVSRTFTKMDGLPDTDSLRDYGKGINYFDPIVLSLHKEFAKQLLTHVSPYTGKSLVNDPVMAMVEITNENSLYRYWRDGGLKPFAAGGILTLRHVRMLDSLWNSFLKSRYANTPALANAWSQGAFASNGLNRLVNGTFENARPTTGWVMEIHAPANAVVQRDSVSFNSGRYSAKVTVTQSDGTDWHLQWKQIGLSMTKDTLYVVAFAARSDSARPVNVSLMKDVSPWTWYGGTTVLLTPGWKTYSFSLRAPETVASVLRLSFAVGAQAGGYWFDDLSMTTSGVDGLLPGESLENSTVQRIDYSSCARFTDQRVRDLSSFYIKLQDEYFFQMRTYLRDTLGVRVPIAGTNWNIGPADMVVQSKLDYIDNHAYWDHPSFPGIPWSSTDWYIANTPMVQSAEGGTITRLMPAVPAKGKPFTISEYNHPFPNRFQSEALVFLSSYASFHDADAVMIFEYNSSVDDWETDKIANYFSIHRNSAMMALAPSCAAAFRSGMIATARHQLVVDYAPDDYLVLPRRDVSGWLGPSLLDRTLALTHAVRAGSFAATSPFDPRTLPSPQVSPFLTDTKEIRWDTNGLLTVSSGRFAAVVGFLNNSTLQQPGPLLVKTANGFGTVTWVSLTRDTLRDASLSLLTISSMAQNSGMVWEGTTTIHNNWGTSPTQIAPLILTLQLSINADSLKIWPLDEYGRETRGFSSYRPSSPGTFLLTVDQNQSRSMWYGIEAFGRATVSDVITGNAPTQFNLEQNYPNPFNPSTTIQYDLPKPEHVTLVVCDMLGQVIDRLVDEKQNAGIYRVRWDASNTPSGVYFYRLQAGSFVETRKMILLR